MVIWSRLGFLVGLVLLLLIVGTNALADLIWGAGYSNDHTWPAAVAFILTGVISWFLGKFLNKPSGRVMIDKETGEEVTIKDSAHSFFFIPVQFWGPIFVVIAIVYSIVNITSNKF